MFNLAQDPINLKYCDFGRNDPTCIRPPNTITWTHACTCTHLLYCITISPQFPLGHTQFIPYIGWGPLLFAWPKNQVGHLTRQTLPSAACLPPFICLYIMAAWCVLKPDLGIRASTSWAQCHMAMSRSRRGAPTWLVKQMWKLKDFQMGKNDKFFGYIL